MIHAGLGDPIDIDVLCGKTLTRIVVTPPLGQADLEADGTQIIFYAGAETWAMQHIRECCEIAYLAEVIGELDWLIGSPIVTAECVFYDDDPDSTQQRWTFYRLAVASHPCVTLRWMTESNGYYSVAVELRPISAPETETCSAVPHQLSLDLESE